MAKPNTESLPSHVQDAAAMFDSVVAGHVANNPKLAQEEKLANMIEGVQAFKGRANEMQAADTKQQVAAQTVGDMSKDTTRQV